MRGGTGLCLPVPAASLPVQATTRWRWMHPARTETCGGCTWTRETTAKPWCTAAGGPASSAAQLVSALRMHAQIGALRASFARHCLFAGIAGLGMHLRCPLWAAQLMFIAA